MADLAEQLAILRKKIAQVEERCAQKYVNAAPPPMAAFQERAEPIESVISGSIVETAHGRHFQTEKLHARHRRHGSVEIADLIDLPADLLEALSGGAIANCRPERWAFLDTETTGLAGGSGTYAFLIGIGNIEASGFRVRQFFMRDHEEERSQLTAVAEYLSQFDVLITYNGKSFDQPLLETRYTMTRTRHPFGRMEHLDLLFGARRLWKMRLENCRLSHLETQILGVERDGDVPGSLIPHYYFEYVRYQRALNLAPVFHHNVMDIVTLACLTALVPQTFRDPAAVQVRHGADLLGLGRWLTAEGREEEALGLMRRAVQIGLPDPLLFRTLFEIGLLEKKRKNEPAALAAFVEVAGCGNAFRARALEELAKHYEHRERKIGMALEMTRDALRIEDTPELRTRLERLLRKQARAPRLLPIRG
jgi:uncharacterized protein YprB with RNaseH-like and TPR domain